MIGDLQGVPTPRSNKSSGEEAFMPFGCNVLTKSLVDYARNHLNETEETKRKGLEEIREFVRSELKVSVELPDLAYLCFLRSRKFDVRRSCSLVKESVKFVESQKHLFDRTDTDSIRRTVRSKVLGFLPYRDAKGRAIILIRTECWNPSELKVDDLLFGCIASLQVAAENPVSQVAGFVVIVDLKNLSVQQVVSASNWLILILQSLQRCCPCLVKEFHIVHTPTVFRATWKVIKPFISEKIKKRMSFYKSSHWDSLHRRISPQILPEELGGHLGPYSYEHWAGDIADIERKFSERYSQFLNRHKEALTD